MNAFDYTTITFLNQFAHKSAFFDALVNLFVFNNLLKGGVLALVIWYLWFWRHTANRTYVRQILLATLMGAFLAMFLTRVLVHVLPFRTRPLFNKELHFVRPYADWRSQESSSFTDINSMPSDHGTLLYALATGIFLVSRRWGWAVLAYVTLFICLPRVYVGVHHPTDLLVGGLVGVACVLLTTLPIVRRRVFAPALELGKQYPGVLYVGLFLITYQIGTMFDEVRTIMVFMFGTH